MNYDQVLIRFGDLMLKGKNRNTFINQVVRLIRQNIKDLNVEMNKTHDRVYLTINDTSKDLIIERLMRVSGIGSFSFVKTCSYELNDIVETAVTLLNKELDEETTFKVETKRADKTFPYTSQDFSKVISKEILPKLNHKVVVDLHHPKATLKIEIRENQVYLYLKSYKGLGGFPVGVAGNGVLMLSGGIDSPVAGFLAMKQGVQLEGIHFESTPLTSIESAQKVIDIAKKLALYSPKHEFNVLMVPFTKLHQAILLHVPESYIITVMRRMMFRIAEKLALKRDALAIVTGESIGQVASQTLNSMKTIESVTTLPIIRPLAVYDKQDIIKISQDIDTFNISIRPFEDCCTVYVPKSPSTMPSIKKALQYENYIPNYETLIDEIVENTHSWWIKSDSKIDLSLMGFTVPEAWDVINHD